MKRFLTAPLSLTVFALLVIAACSPLAPRDQGRSFMFTLEAIAPAAQPTHDATLVVDHPTAKIELDTYRVALIREDGVFDYFARTRWVDFISPMVLDSMVFSLEDSGLFKNVLAEHTAFAGDYVLKSEIREFNAVYASADDPPEIRIALACILLKGDRKTRIATFTAKGTAKAKENSLEAIHEAFNTAFAESQKATVQNLRDLLKD